LVLEAPAPVLLVEVVNADQFPGRVSYRFPIVSAYFQRQGCRVRWLRFGISTTHLLAHQRDEITLADGEMQHLLDIVDEHAPGLVILTDALHTPQMEALAERAPGASFEIMGPDGRAHRLARDWQRMTADPDFAPDYDWEAGNDAGAARASDNIYLLLDGACGHWHGIRNNPVYSGIDDPRLAGRVGCTFCQSRREHREPGHAQEGDADGSPTMCPDATQGTPLEWISRQVRAIAACRGSKDRFPNALLLEQLGRASVLGTCIDTMCACGMAGRTQLLLAVRSDQVARVGGILREHFSGPGEGTLAIGIYATGIESFCNEDLLLFNKGTTPLDGLRAINTLRELSGKHPERFSFTGVSLLLFTPWTTPVSLGLNAGILHFLRVTRGELGNMFQSRLRMHHDLPITILAEREGLLVNDEPDPVLVMNRRKLFSGERAWRFKDPRMRPLCRLVLRFDLLDSDLADPLTKAIADELARAGVSLVHADGSALLEVLNCLVDAVQAEESVLDEQTLLKRALTTWRTGRERAGRPPPVHRFRIGEQAVDLAGLLERLVPLLKAGDKQLMSVKGVSRAEVDSAVDSLAGLPRELVKTGTATHANTLLVASTTDVLREGLALQSILRGRDSSLVTGAIERAGMLHGVPACCAQAYAKGAFGPPDLQLWAAFDGRLAVSSPIPADTHPLWIPTLGFVPCAADCPRAAAAYRDWFGTVGSRPSSRGRTAWLFSFDGPGDGALVGLSVRRADDTVLEYEAQDLTAEESPLRELLQKGERLRMAPGQILIQRGTETVASLNATHGVWYSERAWHQEEWREMARAAVFVATEPRRPVVLGAVPRGRRATQRSRSLERILEVVVERLGDAARGAVIERACYDGPYSTISLTLSLGGRRYDLMLEARGAEACLFRTESFNVLVARSTPLTERDHIRIVRRIAAGFDRLASRHAPEFVPRIAGKS
jgi:hypothetical protein